MTRCVPIGPDYRSLDGYSPIGQAAADMRRNWSCLPVALFPKWMVSPSSVAIHFAVAACRTNDMAQSENAACQRWTASGWMPVLAE